MHSINFQNSQHTNAYSWPKENDDLIESESVSQAEFRLQFTLLNKRIDLLSKMLKETLSHKQQENLHQLFGK
jgi:hypothetical protein